MPLQHTHRPNKLKQLVGNRATKAAIKSTLGREDPPHAFLLTGESGTGKTTIARIIRKMLKCKLSEFHALDSADFRGIDTVRSIKQQMHYMPAEGNVTVWLLDECHKLTPDAQEALLKALEDTPDHVFFILATTNPEKLKVALKRRCTELSVAPLSDEEMMKLMTDILTKEEKTVPDDILEQIMDDALGSAGIALSVLDTIVDLDEKDMLAAADRQLKKKNEAIEVFRELMRSKPSWKSIAKLINGLEGEPESTRRSIRGLAAATLLKSYNKEAHLILEAFHDNFFDTLKTGLVEACADKVYGGGE